MAYDWWEINRVDYGMRIRLPLSFVTTIVEWDTTMNGPVPDFYQLLYQQIPDKLKGKLDIDVHSDACHLRTAVKFTIKDRPEMAYTTTLEDVNINGRDVAIGIPRKALAWMGLFFT